MMISKLWRGQSVSILIIIGLMLLSYTARANDVVVVLSSELPAYKEALAGFSKVFGTGFDIINLQTGKIKISATNKVVVAIGSKAALYEYPSHVALIYTLAPGINLESYERSYASLSDVELIAPSQVLMEKITGIQPHLKRLGVLWSSEAFAYHIAGLEKLAAARGITLYSDRLNGPQEFPARLRSLYGSIDAILLMPDPLLITPKSFITLREYSWANKIPLYVANAGLVEQGATAAVSISFFEAGRTAAQSALRLLDGKQLGPHVYPETIEVLVNLDAAKNAGLNIPEANLEAVKAKVLP